MTIVDVDEAIYRLRAFEVIALFYVHHMNIMNSRSEYCKSRRQPNTMGADTAT